MSLIHSLLLSGFLLLAPLSTMAEVLDINVANEDQLTEQMVGIGPAKAVAIVEYRSNHGLFGTVDDLVNVKGIGERTVERNRDLITALPRKKNP